MAVVVDVQLKHKGAQDLIKRMTDIRKEVTTLAAATKTVEGLPLTTQQQLQRMDNAIGKTRALRDRVTDVRKELQSAGTPRLLELAAQEARESLVDMNAINDTIRELRDELEAPVNNQVAKAIEDVARPKTSVPDVNQYKAIFGSETPLKSDIAGLAGIAGQFSGTAGQVGRIAGEILNVSSNIAEVGKTFGEVNKSSLALIGSTAILTGLIYGVSKAMNDSAERAREIVKAEKERVQAALQTRDDLRRLDAESARQQREDLETELRLNEKALDDTAKRLMNSIDSVDGFFDSAAKSAGFLGHQIGVNVGEVGAAIEEIEKWNEDIAKNREEIERLRAVEERLAAKEAGRNAADRFVTELEQQLEREMFIIDATNNLTKEGALERLATLELERKGQEAVYERLKERTDQVWKELETAINEGADQADIDELSAEAARLQEKLNGLYAPLQKTNQQIEDFNNLIIPEIELREAEADAIESASEARKRDIDALKAFQKSQDELRVKVDNASKSLQTARQALADFETQLADEARTRAQENAIRSRQASELAAIDTQIEAAKASENAAKQRQKQNEFEVKSAQKLTDMRTKFADDELKRQRDFQTQLTRFTEDTAIRARRLFEDAEKSIKKAVADNDFAAFIDAVEKRDADLQRLSEDATLDNRRRIEDFTSESKDRLREFSNSLLTAEREIAEQRLRLQQEAGTQELSLVQQLQQRRAALVAKHTQELENFRIQQETAAINRRRQLLIADINARQQEYEALRKQAHANAFNIGRNALLGFFSGASAQQRQIVQTVTNAGNQAIQSIKNVLPSFANEGVASQPMLALVGDKRGHNEAMINFPKSSSLGEEIARRGLGTKVEVNIGAGAFTGVNGQLDIDRIGNQIGWKIVQVLESRHT